MSFVRPVNMDDTLNLMFKCLPPNKQRPLENFNGARMISVFRGDVYLNKITQKKTVPPLTFIRHLINIGTKSDPKMATKVLALKVPRGDFLVYYNEAGDSMKGVTLNLYRSGFVPYKKEYPSMMELRQDLYFLSSVKALTGKNFIRPGMLK